MTRTGISRHAGVWYAKSLDVLGSCFGVTGRTCQNWLAAGAPPKTVYGYPIAATFQWYCALGPGAPDDPELQGPPSDELERLRKAKADLAELDLKERRGELVDPDDGRNATMRLAHVIRSFQKEIFVALGVGSELEERFCDRIESMVGVMEQEMADHGRILPPEPEAAFLYVEKDKKNEQT